MGKGINALLFIFILGLGVFSNHALADAKRGERLHNSHCVACHASAFDDNGTAIYTRPNRRVTTPQGLERQVRFCVQNLRINWFDDKIRDVVDYLNHSFYKFDR